MTDREAVRPPKEIVILLVLLVLAMGSVLWYVIDRRSRMHPAALDAGRPVPLSSAEAPSAATAAPPKVAATAPRPPGPAPAVDLTAHDGQTIDFSSGQPVVQQSAADKAALAAGLKDIAEATKDVTFDPPKAAESPAAPAKH